jgi:hypothetical protein
LRLKTKTNFSKWNRYIALPKKSPTEASTNNGSRLTMSQLGL